MINVRQKYAGVLVEMGDDIQSNLKEATQVYGTAQKDAADRKNILNSASEAFRVAFDVALKLIQQLFLASVFKKKKAQLLASGFGKIISTLKESDDKSETMAKAEKDYNEAVRVADNALKQKNLATQESERFRVFTQPN